MSSRQRSSELLPALSTRQGAGEAGPTLGPKTEHWQVLACRHTEPGSRRPSNSELRRVRGRGSALQQPQEQEEEAAAASCSSSLASLRTQSPSGECALLARKLVRLPLREEMSGGGPVACLESGGRRGWQPVAQGGRAAGGGRAGAAGGGRAEALAAATSSGAEHTGSGAEHTVHSPTPWKLGQVQPGQSQYRHGS